MWNHPFCQRQPFKPRGSVVGGRRPEVALSISGHAMRASSGCALVHQRDQFQTLYDVPIGGLRIDTRYATACKRSGPYEVAIVHDGSTAIVRKEPTADSAECRMEEAISRLVRTASTSTVELAARAIFLPTLRP